jgi:hypothetical protein
MKKLPIGIQSFEKIRTEGYYYVDKTPFVVKLVNEGAYYFLSRPRRFGKSLFLDTLRQAFLGRRELFEGLYLENNWDWSVKYPVIYIDFGGVVIENSEHLKTYILELLENNQEELGVISEKKGDYNLYFRELIIRTSERYKQKVVVLVDEYDKPILDRIEEREEALRIREVLKNFYSVLKPLDRYLKFVFLTGVSKFSKVSLFSGLNQLNDITLDKRYATICGYTQGELESVFAEELKGEDLEAVKCWYNGYSWLGEPVYNPFDILLYLQKRQFHPYWFETGTPEFLIKLLVEKRFYMPELTELIASERLLGSFDVDFIEPENLLFQTGYLTIKRYQTSRRGFVYYLGYPNKEVEISLNDYIASYLTQAPVAKERLAGKLEECLRRGDLEGFKEVLRSLFASIPYEWYRKNEIAGYEGYYASVVYSFLAGAGLDLIAEDYTSRGRIDLTILYDERCYVVEFKVVELEPEGKALKVLLEKGYGEKYRGRFKEIYLIGIEFSKERKDLVSFEWERLGG